MGIIVILHNVSSSVYEFLDYKLVHTTTLIINLLICLSYPLNFGIYCGMSRQFRETFKELFMKVCYVCSIKAPLHFQVSLCHHEKKAQLHVQLRRVMCDYYVPQVKNNWTLATCSGFPRRGQR